MENNIRKMGVIFAATVICLIGFANAGSAAQGEKLQDPNRKNRHIMPAQKPVIASFSPAYRHVSENTQKQFQNMAAATIDADSGIGALPDNARVKITDANGNLIGWRFEDITRDDAGRIIKNTVVTYNKKGNKISSRTRTYDYTLDDSGKVSSVAVTCKKGGKVIWTAEHTYTRDENGRIAGHRATFKDADGNVIRTAVQAYTRDEQGRITESSIERKNADGKTIATDNIKATYDENGQIAQKIVTRTNAAGNKKFELVTNYKDGIAKNAVKKFYTNTGDVYRKEIANYS